MPAAVIGALWAGLWGGSCEDMPFQKGNGPENVNAQERGCRMSLMQGAVMLGLDPSISSRKEPGLVQPEILGSALRFARE
jgi:hypothetical protein